MGGEGFQVMTIATGRNRLSGIHKFYAQAEVTNLPILLDPKGKLATRMGALGLPVTVLLDREGREISRLNICTSDKSGAIKVADAARVRFALGGIEHAYRHSTEHSHQ